MLLRSLDQFVADRSGLEGGCPSTDIHVSGRGFPPPDAYETHKPQVDILFGTSSLREALDSPQPVLDNPGLTEFDRSAWLQRPAACRLYD